MSDFFHKVIDISLKVITTERVYTYAIVMPLAIAVFVVAVLGLIYTYLTRWKG